MQTIGDRFDSVFGRTVRPMLSVRCLSVLSVCNVRAMWPNGWTDQDETWHAGRPRPCPKFSAHVYCGQTAGWIRIPLGTEVGLGPGDIVLGGDPAPSTKGGTAAPSTFGPCVL